MTNISLEKESKRSSTSSILSPYLHTVLRKVRTTIIRYEKGAAD